MLSDSTQYFLSQLLWLKIVVNGEMQSNHPDMFQSPTLAVGEKMDNKLDSKQVK